MLGSVNSTCPCPRCLAAQTDLARPMLVQQREPCRPRTLTDLRAWILDDTLSTRELEALSFRPNDHASSPFTTDLLPLFDLCKHAAFDELHVLWSGFVADLHSAVQDHVHRLGETTSTEVDRRLKGFPSFPNLLQLQAYHMRSMTSKVYETLLQVRLSLAFDMCFFKMPSGNSFILLHYMVLSWTTSSTFSTRSLTSTWPLARARTPSPRSRNSVENGQRCWTARTRARNSSPLCQRRRSRSTSLAVTWRFAQFYSVNFYFVF